MAQQPNANNPHQPHFNIQLNVGANATINANYDVTLPNGARVTHPVEGWAATQAQLAVQAEVVEAGRLLGLRA